MKRRFILFTLMLACIGCDQGTKYTAKHFLEGQRTLSYLGDSFRLSYAENTGAFLGLGAGMPQHFRQIVFIVLVSMLLLGFLFYVVKSNNLNLYSTVACAFIIGGGLSNLIDRVINQGTVIDFMNFGIGSLRTGIFNIADMAIMAGTFIFILFNRKTA